MRTSKPHLRRVWRPAETRVGAALAIALTAASLAPAQTRTDHAPSPTGAPLPPEEARLDTAVFRAALQKRGLKDVLDLHVREFPPIDALARRLMQRDMKLAEFADKSLPRERRLAAVADANRILLEVIAEHPNHSSRLAWRFEVARSVLYDETEWMLAPVLHRESPPREPARLANLAGLAVQRVDELLADLAEANARLDALPLEEFEAEERSGRVAELDRLHPRARYLRLWALFYDAARRDADDPGRAAALHLVMDALQADPEFVETPHEESRVQVQALSLAGMTQRRLNNLAKARELLDRALFAAAAITDARDSERVSWAVALGQWERIRVDRDDGKYAQALAGAEGAIKHVDAARADAFSRRLSGAMLLRSVERAWAASEESAGRNESAGRHRSAAWRGLARLVESDPARAEEVFMAVFDSMGGKPDMARDAMDRAALVFGFLATPAAPDPQADDAARRALEVGDALLAESEERIESLAPLVRFQLAAAEFRLGRTEQAARRFLEVATRHPAAPSASQAATLAVQLAHELQSRDASRGSSTADDLFRQSLERLVTAIPESEAARYWRFFFAVELHRAGRYREAAEQFALVAPDHDLRLEALRLRILSITAELSRDACQAPARTQGAIRVAGELVALQGQYEREATDRPSGDQESSSGIAETLVAIAECHLLDTVDSPLAALELLATFEERFPHRQDLWGRVWRVRLVAHDRLGRLDEAMEAVPKYADVDPDGARVTIQWLYETLAAQADAMLADELPDARPKAEAALKLAERLVEWEAGRASKDRRMLLMLGEANLRAERFDRARDLFIAVMELDARGDTPADDARWRLGLGESLLGLGEPAAALPHFNRLAMRLSPDDPTRWRSLLRDLQCRAALEEHPERIIQVIEQQRFLYPDMGGRPWAPKFDKLLAESIRRRDAMERRSDAP